MYLLLGFLRFSVIFFAMARYLQFTVKLGTDFPKNVLEAFGPQKSKSTIGKAILLQPEALLNNFLTVKDLQQSPPKKSQQCDMKLFF